VRPWWWIMWTVSLFSISRKPLFFKHSSLPNILLRSSCSLLAVDWSHQEDGRRDRSRRSRPSSQDAGRFQPVEGDLPWHHGGGWIG
jgi:hypothetical protein